MTTRGTNVLVVEDDLQTLNLERLILEGGGYTVTATARGEEAIEMVADATLDLILLDVGLPGIDGFTTCKVIRKFSRVPIIMVTGSDDGGDKVKGLDIGADDYITKPFSEKELFARSKAVLRRSHAGGRASRQATGFGGKVLRPVLSISYVEKAQVAWRQFLRIYGVLRDGSLQLAAIAKQGMLRGLDSPLAHRVKAGGPVVKLADVADRARRSELAQRVRADASTLWSAGSTAAREAFSRHGENKHTSPDRRLETVALLPAPEAATSSVRDDASCGHQMIFLEDLLRAYLRESASKYSDPMVSAPVLPLVDIYQQMLSSSWLPAKHTREQFARDVYLLHCSGVDCTPTGAKVQFPISRGVPNKTLIVTDDAGREVKYYGVRFTQTESLDHKDLTPGRPFDDSETANYRVEIQEAFYRQVEWPSEGFARLLAAQLNFGELEQREVRQFAQVIRDALQELVEGRTSDGTASDAAG